MVQAHGRLPQGPGFSFDALVTRTTGLDMQVYGLETVGAHCHPIQQWNGGSLSTSMESTASAGTPIRAPVLRWLRIRT